MESFQTGSRFRDNPGQSIDEHYYGEIRVNYPRTSVMSPVMTKRRVITIVGFVSTKFL